MNTAGVARRGTHQAGKLGPISFPGLNVYSEEDPLKDAFAKLFITLLSFNMFQYYLTIRPPSATKPKEKYSRYISFLWNVLQLLYYLLNNSSPLINFLTFLLKILDFIISNLNTWSILLYVSNNACTGISFPRHAIHHSYWSPRGHRRNHKDKASIISSRDWEFRATIDIETAFSLFQRACR